MVCAHLTDNDVLNLRESGQHRSPVEQALMVLSMAYPDMTWQQLAALSLGDRDARLLAVRERTFGTMLEVFTTCPKCRQALELRLTTTKLGFRVPNGVQETGHGFSTVIDDQTVQYRLPDSTDLEAVATCKNIDAARKLLLDRCVLEIQNATGEQREPIAKREETFTPAFVTALARQMTEQDPQAEVLLNLQCVECKHEWQSLFDVASFFWAELESHAKRLLSEIYILARSYHWREQDILALTPTRRKWYLEMATA
jgi:hypothetical protein